MDPLETIVCRITGAQRAVRGERIQSLWSGYGELVRMALEGVGTPNVVVKHVAPEAVTRRGARAEDTAISHRRKLRSYAVEMAFYQRYAAECDARCRVACLLGARHANDQWVFVMEDLDAAGFHRRPRSPNQQEVQCVLRWLAQFHARFLGRPPDGLWGTGTYWHLETRRNELAQIRNSAVRAGASKFDARLNAACFKTLVHGDAKLDNFCFGTARATTASSATANSASLRSTASDAPVVAAVDFQYVGGGCGIKDVAYFFSSIWNAAECSAYADDALAFYFVALRNALTEHGRDRDAPAIQTEWADLYPFAWSDFQRFLCGWAPGQYDDDAYAARMIRIALAGA
jgi:hypothetical protein